DGIGSGPQIDGQRRSSRALDVDGVNEVAGVNVYGSERANGESIGQVVVLHNEVAARRIERQIDLVGSGVLISVDGQNAIEDHRIVAVEGRDQVTNDQIGIGSAATCNCIVALGCE